MNDWDSDEWDVTGYDSGDDEEFDDSVLVTCSNCQSSIYDDTPQCPVCGEYVTHSNSPWEGKPLWWVALGLLGVLATMLALAGL